MEYNKKEQLLDKVSGLKYMNPSGQGFYHNKALDTACVHIKEFFDEGLVPEVPQCVIDWYEDNKDNLDYNLWNYIMDWDYHKSSDFREWLDTNKQAFQTIVNMDQFGYKLMKEKKYLVKIKGLTDEHSILKYGEFSEAWYFGDTESNICIRKYHTRKQIEEAGLSGVFDDPMFIVEEVE